MQLTLVIPRKTRVLISKIFPYLEHRGFYMKTSRFSDTPIIAILKQAEARAPVPELCREHGISTTFYKWRSKFGEWMFPSWLVSRSWRTKIVDIKKIYAKERLKAEIITEAMAKKW
jgi:putative transposase